MRVEMNALEKNETWEILDKPRGQNIVDCKWIFKLKYKADGSRERFMARLVAKGLLKPMELIIKTLLLLLLR